MKALKGGATVEERSDRSRRRRSAPRGREGEETGSPRTPHPPAGAGPDTHGAWTPRGQVRAAAALVVLAFAVFANALPNAFHLDDFYRVVNNPGIQTLSPWWRHFVDVRTMATLPTITNFRPLLPLTLSLNYAVGGLNPVGYHVVNLVLQAAAAVLIYFLSLSLLTQSAGVRAGFQPWVALTTAAVFAVHPVSGIPVNYVSARDLLLMQVFMIGSLLAYTRMRGRGDDTLLAWALVLLLYVLALLSKTGVVVMAGLVTVYEVTVRRQRLLSVGPWLRAAPFLALAGAFFLYVSLVLHHSEVGVVRSREYTPLVYGATQAKLHLFHYLRNFVWPFPIRQGPAVAPVGPGNLGAAAGAVFVAATLATAWRLRRSVAVVTLCILTYWALLVPEASIFPLWALATDYRPYASSPFLYLGATAAAASFVPWRRVLAAAAVLAVVWSAATSVALNTTWRTDRSLWLHSVKHGGSALAYLNLAMSYDDPATRAQHLREALRLSPNYILAHMNLGLALIEMGQYDEGLSECRKAVTLDPGRAQTRYWMARAYGRLGRPADEAREAAAAARLDPANIEYAYGAGAAAEGRRNWAEAAGFFESVARRDPPHKDALFRYGFALQMAGRVPEAVAAYRAHLARAPSHVQTLFNLGFALMEGGDCRGAVPLFGRVLALRPAYAAAHLHLSTCFERLGEPGRATAHRSAWIRSQPGPAATEPPDANRPPETLRGAP